jgi:N-acetylglucosaminyldiphosphoundecaprenol N-acetyl-beta-D-mannosaminyltransferase
MKQSIPRAVSEFASRVHILGVPVNVLGMTDVLGAMEDWIRERNGCRWIAVTSSHGILEGHRRPEFKAILRSADLSIPDGMWTARAAAHKARAETRQIRGAELLWEFCRLSYEKGYSNFFYGDTWKTLGQCRQRLLAHFPKLRIAGLYSPPFRGLTQQEDAEIVEKINRAKPDVLWVALGLPKQEQWIFAHRSRLHVPIAVAVGAAVKFVGGSVKSAPEWASRSGAEWLWRLVHEPRRVWRRALVYGPQFAAHTLLDVYGLRRYD